MNLADIDFISEIVKRRIGIVLGREKDYLLDTRLAPLVRQFGLTSVAELVHAVRKGNREIEDAALEAMTTNETLFFRDRLPFEQLERVILPALTAARPAGTEIRIWCVACSSGQEPYSIAMLLDQMAPRLSRHRFSILATDVSHTMVARAKSGTFSQFEIQRGLAQRYLDRYFKADGPVYRIDPSLQRFITFQRFNVLDETAGLGTFDLILCRNLLIYFDETQKRQTLQKLSQRLAPEGYLILGAAETVIGLSTAFEYHNTERALYVNATRGQKMPPPRLSIVA
jgi:chemotaxis protein methyltransferase CheR